MQIIYRLYNNLESSVFDLISGDLEIQQTKGLALLLGKEITFLNTFLELPQIRRITGKVILDRYSKIIVNSELISANRKRADIVISFYKDNQPDFCIIIEAKSINKTASTTQVLQQIKNYINTNEFPQLNNFRKKSIILTKNKVVISDADIDSVTWNDIVNELVRLNPVRGTLIFDFLNFLININGSMKFYEKEVFSIPAGDSYKYQSGYPFIYECPNTTKYALKKKPLYLTFRKSGIHGGVMECLYGLDEIIILNPKQDLETFLASETYDTGVKNRIKHYCLDLWNGNYPDEEKQFFILSLDNQINLKHKPKPPVNNAFRAYYKLADLLNEDLERLECE